MGGGLAGRTVLVTRPREQAWTLCDALRSRGARPVEFPTLTIRAADTADLDLELRRLDRFDWVVFTSANGVRFFAERLAAVGPRGLPLGIRVAAVGPATARAAADRGLPTHAMPGEFTGAAVPAAMGHLAGSAVLLPRADIGREEAGAALRAAGATVTEVTVYHTVPETPDPAARRALDAGVDAATFTSPSAIRNLAALLGDDARRVLRHAVIACLGGTTAAATRALGFPVHVQARTATVEGLVEALAAHYDTTVPVP
jgi:uroporphyrinogen-III synthase